MIRRPGRQHRRPRHLLKPGRQQYFAKTPLVPVRPSGGQKRCRRLFIVEHARLIPRRFKAGLIDADFLHGQPSGVFRPGVKKQALLGPAEGHGQIRTHGLPHHPARGRVDAAGHINGQLIALPAVYLPDDCPILPLYLPGESYTEKSIHQYSIFLNGPVTDHPDRIKPHNFILPFPFPGTMCPGACRIHRNLPAFLRQDPGHGQSVCAVIAASRHYQKTFILRPQLSGCGISPDLLRHRQSRPLHQHRSRHTQDVHNSLLIMFHLPGIHHIFHNAFPPQMKSVDRRLSLPRKSERAVTTQQSLSPYFFSLPLPSSFFCPTAMGSYCMSNRSITSAPNKSCI